jgi:glycosyltransferase involved in cell wall biosynthesis
LTAALSIGLNLAYLVPESGGTGTYARELIPALLEAEPDTRVTAFAGRTAPDWLRDSEWSGAIDIVTLKVTYDRSRPWNAPLALLGQWATLPAAARRRRLDVVHGLANVAPLWTPGAVSVVTIHDLIWTRHTQTMSRIATASLRAATWPSARRASRVITDSDAVREDLVATIGVARDRVDVVPLGIRPPAADMRATAAGELRARLGVGDRPVVLAVGQKREHKNLTGLLRAVARMGNASTAVLLAGAPSDHETELRALAGELGLGERAVFLGWVEDADLAGLYDLAAVVAVPSFDEGFGLPVLEAMARGAAVVAANAWSLPEVAGDAAILFDPHDVDAITSALDRVVGDPGERARLAAAGRERAATFTWRRTAEGTLASYRRALAAASARGG